VGERPIGLCHDQVDPRGAADFAELHRRALAGENAETDLAGDEDLVGGPRRRSISVRPRRDADGTIVGVVASVSETAIAGGELAWQDARDGLTGLAGRHRFMA